MSDEVAVQREPINLAVEVDPFAPPPRRILAATPGQLEIWVSGQVERWAGCAYNESFSIHLRGTIDEEAMLRAVQILPDLHEALRGHLSEDGAEFIIEPSITIVVPRHDLSRLAVAERQAALADLEKADGRTPYDLARGPLFRAALVHLSTDEYIVMLGAHHLASDGWSLDVMLADLGKVYSGFAGFAALPAPPRHGFGDYIINYVSTAEHRTRISAAQEFWRKTLREPPAPLELPADGYRPARRSYAARHSQHLICTETHAAAKAFARSEAVSLFAVLMSTYATLLYRLTSQADIVIGTPVAGHPDAGMEDCVGNLVNMVPIRCLMSGAMSFKELCQTLNTTILDARENAAVGFGAIVGDLGLPRDASRVPLIASVFTHVQKYSSNKLVFADASVDYRLNPRSFETFELNLNAIEARDDILLKGYVNADLYSQEWLNWRLAEFEVLMASAVAAPAQALDDLPMLPAAEQEWLRSINRTSTPWDRNLLIHRWFERVVDEQPNAPALCFESSTLDYRTLDQLANQLAHALVSFGVGPDDRVGIHLPRDPRLVIAMLGVLKAGGGYLPLDLHAPADRIAGMLEDASARVLITTAELAAALPKKPPLLLLDKKMSALRDRPNKRLRRPEHPAQLAYTIYTSGSTGRPKGVMVEHRNVVSFFVGMEKSARLIPGGVWLSGTTIAFDISVLEILGSLTHGRAVVLVGETVLGIVADEHFGISELIRQYRVTHFQCTPTQCRLLLLDAAGREALASLRQLIVGGEALPQDLADELAKLVRGSVVNAYGPTETTIWSTAGAVQAQVPVCIGRPIANTVVHILDQRGRLAPFGCSGELYIGGPGVTRGYLGRAELTAERFVPDELTPAPGERLYRTGDVVRFRPDGCITYLGRNDQQVKIRGYRIEMGEIETAIREMPGVANVAITVYSRVADAKELIAYLITTAQYPGDDALRSKLRTVLPEYMVPNAIMHLAQFPLTPNGKLDRKALPQPTAQLEESATNEAPESEVERQLLDIWRPLLGRTDISATADFFSIGGQSLIAVHMFDEIQRQFGIRLPMATLFECPTIRQLAARLRPALAAPSTSGAFRALRAWTTVVPIRRTGSLPPLFCFAGLGGNPLNLRHLAQALGPDQPFYALQYRGVDGTLPPHRTIHEIALESLADIREVQPQGPYFLSGYSAGGLAAIELARLLIESGEEVRALVLLDTSNPITLQWNWRKRLAAHWTNFCSAGPAYVFGRLQGGLKRRFDAWRIRWRARSAIEGAVFEHRLDAVWQATLEAESTYVPSKLRANVTLIKTDYFVPASIGIGYPQHESNGWREYMAGPLTVVTVQCEHAELSSARLAPIVADHVRQALASA